MKTPSPSKEDSRDPLLNVRDAAKFLNMSQTAVYAALERHELPHLRLSRRRIRFRLKDLDRWLEARTIDPD
jgi:excisionase family DNA binding protein